MSAVNARLQQDLHRFFRVYEDNIDDILRKTLSPPAYAMVKKDIDDEFDTFRRSLLNRLSEEKLG